MGRIELTRYKLGDGGFAHRCASRQLPRVEGLQPSVIKYDDNAGARGRESSQEIRMAKHHYSFDTPRAVSTANNAKSK